MRRIREEKGYESEEEDNEGREIMKDIIRGKRMRMGG